MRSLRTPFPREFLKAEYAGATDEELNQMGIGSVRKAVQEGDLQAGSFLSGQAAAQVNKIQPAADIVRELIEDAEPYLKGAAKWVK